MKHMIIIFICWFTLLPASFAQQSLDELHAKVRANPHDVQSLLALGKLYHDTAVNGDKNAVDNGFDCYDTILAIDPSNAVALVYRGSLWTLRGRDAWWPFTKLSDVNKGIDDMDKAVDMASNDIGIRIVRGLNSVQLPAMFKRLGTALKDFSFLLSQPAFTHLNPSLQSTIFYWSGVAYKRDNQPAKARDLLNKSIAAAPQSDMARSAQKELKDL